MSLFGSSLMRLGSRRGLHRLQPQPVLAMRGRRSGPAAGGRRSFSQAAMSAASAGEPDATGEHSNHVGATGVKSWIKEKVLGSSSAGEAPSSPSGTTSGGSATSASQEATSAADVAGLEKTIGDLETKNLELKEKADDLMSKLRYQMADMENARKRHGVELEQAKSYAISKFAKDIVEVADNLQRALEGAVTSEGAQLESNTELKKLYEGVKLTDDIMLKTFEKYGIQKLFPMKEKFDPNFHEAMFQLDSEEPKDTVVHVMQNGWKLKDRMLRPARVGTSKGPGSGGGAGAAGEEGAEGAPGKTN